MVAPTTPYEKKFADFFKMLAETIDETIVVHHPQVLGDDYDELVESLNRLADAGKKPIVPRNERKRNEGPASENILRTDGARL